MTAQEIFNTVVTHLLTQGRPSKVNDARGMCLYRGPNGMKCAVGVLIPDKMYLPEMEEIQINQFKHEGFSVPSYFHKYSALLQDLQRVHDLCPETKAGRFRLADLHEQLQDVANKHDLEFRK